MERNMMDELPFQPETSAWLTLLERSGRSASTIESYPSDITCVATALQKALRRSATIASLSMIGQSDIDTLNKHWSKQGATRATVLRRLAAVPTVNHIRPY